MKRFLVALLMVGLLAGVSFAETDTSSITANILTPVRAVSMGDVAFGTFLSGSLAKVVSDTDLAFSSNYTYRIRFFGDATGLMHTDGINELPLFYSWSNTDEPVPAPDQIGVGLPWVAIPTTATTLSTGDSCDFNAGNSTFALGMRINAGSPEGDYSTVLNFEILTI